jgi:hypothetical protein
MACHGAIKVTPYQLVYGHDAVLPWEIKTGSRRIFSQDQLTADDYDTLMKDELEDVVAHRLRALVSIEDKGKGVCRWRSGLEVVLPIGTKSSKFSKWSPN